MWDGVAELFDSIDGIPLSFCIDNDDSRLTVGYEARGSEAESGRAYDPEGVGALKNGLQ